MRSFRALTDLVLPNRCAGCHTPGGAWCPDCARPLLGPPTPVDRLDLPPAYALASYQGSARRAVLAYKERGRRELAPHFASALAAALARLPAIEPSPAASLCSGHSGRPRAPNSHFPYMPSDPRAGPLVLVPAPSRPAAARRRGGQHMVAVAERAAAVLRTAGMPATAAEALRLDGRATDSVGLDAADRAANLAGRLRPNRRRAPPPGTRVLLVDDVITTGATAAACVAALESIAVEVTAVLALTAAGPTHP
jgi:predicted amidophosphoribosyltransferase